MKYYGNKPIKNQKEIDKIFELYDKSGVIHQLDMAKLERYLKPPTAEEVCKALSEYLKTPVEYNETFGFIANERVIIYKYLNNVLSFNTNYRPEIHTLIGRFYEGVEK